MTPTPWGKAKISLRYERIMSHIGFTDKTFNRGPHPSFAKAHDTFPKGKAKISLRYERVMKCVGFLTERTVYDSLPPWGQVAAKQTDEG